jgi:hypothetical protein
MKTKTETKVILFLLVITGIAIYSLIRVISEKKQIEKILIQNELALNDVIKKLKYENETFYHKYVSVQSNLTNREEQLKKRDEKILTLNAKELLLKNIVDSLIGRVVVVGKDTNGIPFGSVLEFLGGDEFYKSKHSVFIEEPPRIISQTEFIKFRIKHFLTRDVNGKYSGYSKIEPEFVNKHLDITVEETVIDESEFLRIERDIDKFRLSLIPTIGTLMKEAALVGAGLKALINKKHLVEVTKGISNDWLWVGYGYSFDIIK